MINCPNCNNVLTARRFQDHGTVAKCSSCKKMFIMALLDVTSQMLCDNNVTDKVINNELS